MHFLPVVFSLIVACGHRDEPSTAVTAVSPSGVKLHGTAPAIAVPVPEFTATNRDGTPRDRAAVLGHPTVLWFYPAAGTGG